ncbi:MAG TPA: hypothetical protein PJ986_12115 [Gammaproteobacteria bacterium]|nr:hypothetical protein [Gammaproteobacteria bacterium]
MSSVPPGFTYCLAALGACAARIELERPERADALMPAMWHALGARFDD